MALGKELVLDTKGVCFLCLDEISSRSELGIKDYMEEFCLRNICRYLKIDPSSILLRCFENGSVDEDRKKENKFPMDKYVFSVALCQTCLSVAHSLSDLIRQVEIIKMLLSNELEAFHQILNTDKDSQLTALKTRLMPDNKNPIEARLIETLRNETKQNSCTKMKSLWTNKVPKVLLNDKPNNSQPLLISTKLKESPSVNPAAAPHQSDSKSYAGSSNALKVDQPIMAQKANQSRIRQNPSRSKCFAKFEKHFELLKPENKYKCLVCEDVSAKIRKKDSAKKVHLINFHPEILFKSAKLSSTSESAFKNMCYEMLKLEFKVSNQLSKQKRRMSQNFITKSWRFCKHCKRQFFCHRSFKCHLILEHREDLEKKLLNLQNTNKPKSRRIKKKTSRLVRLPQVVKESGDIAVLQPNMSSKRYDGTTFVTEVCKKYQKVLFSRRSGTQIRSHFTCTICNDSYAHSKIRIHMVSIHPEKFFEEFRLPHVADADFAEVCRKLLKLELSEAAKLKRSCPMNNEWQMICTFCKVKYCDGRHLRYHLVTGHYNILQEKLMRLQNEICEANYGVGNEVIVASTTSCMNVEENSELNDARSIVTELGCNSFVNSTGVASTSSREVVDCSEENVVEVVLENDYYNDIEICTDMDEIESSSCSNEFESRTSLFEEKFEF